MSTRGAIARKTDEGFTGRYHHWDSYPEGLGATLWEIYRRVFGSDLDRILRTLLDEHPAGWSSINGADWDLEPGYGGKIGDRRPACYCHGDRSERESIVTQADASTVGCEYVYAFDRDDAGAPRMWILSSYQQGGQKMIGAFGRGNPDATWQPVAVIELDDPTEPDWERIGQNALGA